MREIVVSFSAVVEGTATIQIEHADDDDEVSDTLAEILAEGAGDVLDRLGGIEVTSWRRTRASMIEEEEEDAEDEGESDGELSELE